jgi:hypothetical protein
LGDLSGVVDALQHQGCSVAFHAALEAPAWSQWRGLSDERLTYFFGSQ